MFVCLLSSSPKSYSAAASSSSSTKLLLLLLSRDASFQHCCHLKTCYSSFPSFSSSSSSTSSECVFLSLLGVMILLVPVHLRCGVGACGAVKVVLRAGLTASTVKGHHMT